MKKQYPKIDEWFQLAARGGFDGKPLDAVERELVAELGKPTAQELTRLRRGYYAGVANGAIYRIQQIMEYVSRDQLTELGAELVALYSEYEAKLTDTQEEA